MIDFSGTSDAQANNFNAPEPITRAAVLYVFRVMVEAPIPMNAGCLKPLRIHIPEGCMLAPAYPRAVVAGNVETSQHATSALFGALGAMANSQRKMNNLTFGNDTYPYYGDDLLGGTRRPDDFGAWVQRHRRRTRAHDQFAPYRPRSAGAAVSGVAGGLLTG